MAQQQKKNTPEHGVCELDLQLNPQWLLGKNMKWEQVCANGLSRLARVVETPRIGAERRRRGEISGSRMALATDIGRGIGRAAALIATSTAQEDHPQGAQVPRVEV